MVYEVVYKIPDKILEEREDGVTFLRQDDLKILEECCLLYFLRTSSFTKLHDYPYLGGYEKRLRSSFIKGPYESAPKIEVQKSYYSELLEEIIELIVPKSSMPVKFEKVKLIEYGTQTDEDSMRHLLYSMDSSINIEEMTKIGDRALENLNKIVSLKKINGSYQASTPDYILNFTNKIGGFMHPKYPHILINIFGREEAAQQLFGETGLYYLYNQFQFMDSEIGIKNSECNGFAYNLLLENIKLPDISNHKNIIL